MKFVRHMHLTIMTPRHNLMGWVPGIPQVTGSECEAVAAHAPEPGVTVAGGFDASEELMHCVLFLSGVFVSLVEIKPP